MIFKVLPGRASFGEAIGIILVEGESYASEGVFIAIPGSVGNASTFSFPVRFQRAKGLTAEGLVSKDLMMLDSVIEAGAQLVKEGVRAVTGDCGFMALFQREVANRLGVPVFLSSLLQVPFISRMLGDGQKVGIITANSQALDAPLLEMVGIDSSIPICIKGLEEKVFFNTASEGVGPLDTEEVGKEVVYSAKELVQEEPGVGAILLECSLLPPYGAAVQEAVDLPVFDFITMINYVYSAVVKTRFHGFI